MRKTTTYMATIGRDKGKQFLITEMAARPAHKWATRAIFAIMNAGLDVPEEYSDSGFAGLAALATSGDKELLVMFLRTLGKVDVNVVEPLLDELLDCVEFIPNPENPNVKRKIWTEDIEEAATYFALQKEAITLHMSFFTGDAQ